MPYAAYKLIHFLGIFTLLTVLAASGMHVLIGGTRSDNPHRRVLGVAHGLASVAILVGGFGMLARLELFGGGLPGWVYLKLAIWLGLSSALMALNKGPRAAAGVLLAVPVLATLAAAIAAYKPF